MLITTWLVMSHSLYLTTNLMAALKDRLQVFSTSAAACCNLQSLQVVCKPSWAGTRRQMVDE